MGAAAYAETSGQFAFTPAALLCALVVFTNGSPFVAWGAIGYVIFGGLLTNGGPHWPLLALALALTPLVPRPRGSVWRGIGVALFAAFAARLAIGLVVEGRAAGPAPPGARGAGRSTRGRGAKLLRD